MAMSSSNESGSSSHNSGRARSRVAGIPVKCWCGVGIVERMSTSEENPHRRYYRCQYAYTNRLRHDPHVFKWVDEAYRNEIEQLDYQVGVLEQELAQMKHELIELKAVAGGIQSNEVADNTEFVTENALNEFENSLLANVDDVMVESLRKMKMMMLALGGCVFVVALGMVLMKA